jgi:hypothetical protein
LQSQFDLALKPEWGNAATGVAKIRVPAGQQIYEGAAAPQGALQGGGNQIFLRNVESSWLIE